MYVTVSILYRKNTKPVARYTEASLIKELKVKMWEDHHLQVLYLELFERKYAEKKLIIITKILISTYFGIKKGQKTVKEETKKTTSEKNKIFITDGKLVDDTKPFSKFVNIILLLRWKLILIKLLIIR